MWPSSFLPWLPALSFYLFLYSHLPSTICTLQPELHFLKYTFIHLLNSAVIYWAPTRYQGSVAGPMMEEWRETDTIPYPDKAYSYWRKGEGKNKPESILIMLGAMERNKAGKGERINWGVVLIFKRMVRNSSVQKSFLRRERWREWATEWKRAPHRGKSKQEPWGESVPGVPEEASIILSNTRKSSRKWCLGRSGGRS